MRDSIPQLSTNKCWSLNKENVRAMLKMQIKNPAVLLQISFKAHFNKVLRETFGFNLVWVYYTLWLVIKNAVWTNQPKGSKDFDWLVALVFSLVTDKRSHLLVATININLLKEAFTLANSQPQCSLNWFFPEEGHYYSSWKVKFWTVIVFAQCSHMTTLQENSRNGIHSKTLNFRIENLEYYCWQRILKIILE